MRSNNQNSRSRTLLRSLCVGAVAVVAVGAFGSAQASAAKWSPPGATVNGTAGEVTIYNGTNTFRCNTSMTMQVALDGTWAKTQPAGGGGVTFSNCTVNGLASGLPVTATMSGQWTVSPSSMTAATVAMPANSLKINVAPGNPGLACTITLGPGALNLSSGWVNATHKLSLSGNNVSFSSTGGFCGGSGFINIVSLQGWYFPTLNMI